MAGAVGGANTSASAAFASAAPACGGAGGSAVLEGWGALPLAGGHVGGCATPTRAAVHVEHLRPPAGFLSWFFEKLAAALSEPQTKHHMLFFFSD